jgi:peptide/nickel transport system permease protein
MRRILFARGRQLILVILGLSTLVFFLIRLSGDPVLVIAGPNATPEQIVALTEKFGFDQPIYVQYFRFLISLVTLDFGRSFLTGQEALGLVLSRIPASSQLALAAMSIAVVVAIPLGISAATHPGTLRARFAQWLALAGQSIPSFVLGIVLILVFAVQIPLFPSFGNEAPYSIVLPAITLSSFIMARQLRLVQAYASEEVKMGYVRTARSLGYGGLRIRYRHILRNVLVPLVSLLGIELGTIIGGAVVTEAVFAWPGLGRTMVASVQARDYPVVQASVLVIGVFVVMINLVVDLLYQRIDPRLRIKETI